MVTTTYDAMLAILDCNETTEKLKDMNNANMPNLLISKVTTLLNDYRELLISEMRCTSLEGHKVDNK